MYRSVRRACADRFEQAWLENIVRDTGNDYVDRDPDWHGGSLFFQVMLLQPATLLNLRQKSRV
jgi:hypothetical protein